MYSVQVLCSYYPTVAKKADDRTTSVTVATKYSVSCVVDSCKESDPVVLATAAATMMPLECAKQREEEKLSVST